jgi:hypothetical protein
MLTTAVKRPFTLLAPALNLDRFIISTCRQVKNILNLGG